MLKKSEEKVLKVINDNAYEKSVCLISKKALIAFADNCKMVSENNIDNLINALYTSDYIDYVSSSKNGEEFYCITLLKKGKNYSEVKKREFALIKRKIFLAVLGATVSFIVGKILLLIFK